MGPHCWWWGPGYFFAPPRSMALGLLFWALVIFAVVRLVILLGRQGEPPHGKRASDILKERYARGEIDDEEFNRKMRKLEA